MVYYLSVGDQNCSEPGILRLEDPNKNNTSKNRYKKNAKGLGKRSGRNFDSNKIEEEEEQKEKEKKLKN